jgi:hypothetical protein
MAYRIAGKYIASCNCSLVCPCPYDGPPTGPDGQCRGLLVFENREGSLDGTDLGGTRWALYNLFPSNLSAGNWKIGVIVDDSASDEQAQAIERIASGEEGGPFGDFAGFVGEYLGLDRARISMSENQATVDGVGEFSWEPFTGPDGSVTTVSKAMFGFAPTFQIGKSSGRYSTKAGADIEAVYGESADYEFSSEMAAEEIRPRA